MINEQKFIDDCIRSAFDNLPLKLTQTIIDKNYFVTCFMDNNKYYPIVDFTQQMTRDYNKFKQISYDLIREFNSQNRWYIV